MTPRLFTLANRNGIEVELSDYGATVTALRVPDRKGRVEDVVLGFDTLEAYLGPHPYFGAMIGRFANRIALGEFSLDGRRFVLRCNEGAHHLHGGHRGFDKAIWSAESSIGTGESAPRVSFRHLSPDGDEGYPGNLSCEVSYSLDSDNRLRIDSVATTDLSTIVGLTHHSYFNLGGPRAGGIYGHELSIEADGFLPVREDLIPTGEVRPVSGTVFDFRNPAAIGARLGSPDPQLAIGRGYDHNFVLTAPSSKKPDGVRRAARVADPVSGRVMEVFTSEPGLQLYTGGGLDGTILGKEGKRYFKGSGFCLETQHFPDSPNQPAFPSVRLDPGERYLSTTIYRFST